MPSPTPASEWCWRRETPPALQAAYLRDVS